MSDKAKQRIDRIDSLSVPNELKDEIGRLQSELDSERDKVKLLSERLEYLNSRYGDVLEQLDRERANAERDDDVIMPVGDEI